MKATPDDLTVREVLDLKSQQMLVINPEYQRGVVWTPAQKKRLVDSVLRGYPIPLIYFHHIRQSAGRLVSERFEVIDGQQRINALYEFEQGAFKLFDPVKDEAQARFPDFIKRQPCPWAGKSFQDLDPNLRESFLSTGLRVVQIKTDDQNEARDLFVRLQAGMPLNSQEKRDAWPGQFTDYILRIGGKPGIARYPGHEFFNRLLQANRTKDRGKFRQLAAQIAMLLFTRRTSPTSSLRDINAEAIDSYYYENLGFDASSDLAVRLEEILDALVQVLGDGKRRKIIGHEAIHLVLLVDSLLGHYTLAWRDGFAAAFDRFRQEYEAGKATKDAPQPSDYWLRYGVHVRVNSDRGENIQRRHEFFAERMRASLRLQLKDPQRTFGELERELLYFQQQKRCAVCDAEMRWAETEVHHVEQHSLGGQTTLENGAVVHRDCHPKSPSQCQEFAAKWSARRRELLTRSASAKSMEADTDEEDDGADL